MNKTLAQMGEEVFDFECEKGWQPNSNTFGDSLTLLHTEISEAFEAFREIGFEYRHTFKPGIEGAIEIPKPDDVASELADVFIRLLSTWHQFMPDEDLEKHYERKMRYNRGRSFRHGGKRI